MRDIAKELVDKGLLSELSYARLQAKEQRTLFSLHWELRTILYLGVLLFTGGLGILVYQNIDTIGHQAVLTFVALACLACFGYCFLKGNPFSPEKHTHESPFFDYVLLLGCLLFLSFEGYLQFQYEVFKTHYHWLALLPSLLFFFLAYRFDHLGVLSMAITGLAAWLGIAITPLQLWESYDYADDQLIWTGIGLGALLGAAGWFLMKRNLKAHFFFTYANFATHLLFVATLAGLFIAERGMAFLWFLGLLGIFAASFHFAKQQKSFYFLLIGILYTYIGLTYLFFSTLAHSNNVDGLIWLGLFYFMGSCWAIVYFLLHHKSIVAKLFGSSLSHEDRL